MKKATTAGLWTLKRRGHLLVCSDALCPHSCKIAKRDNKWLKLWGKSAKKKLKLVVLIFVMIVVTSRTRTDWRQNNTGHDTIQNSDNTNFRMVWFCFKSVSWNFLHPWPEFERPHLQTTYNTIAKFRLILDKTFSKKQNVQENTDSAKGGASQKNILEYNLWSIKSVRIVKKLVIRT